MTSEQHEVDYQEMFPYPRKHTKVSFCRWKLTKVLQPVHFSLFHHVAALESKSLTEIYKLYLAWAIDV